MKLATKDFHPPDHISFASNHPPPGNQPFTSTTYIPHPEVPGSHFKTQLWPIHCVQGTEGAEFADDLKARENELDGVVLKGYDKRVEMYSAFTDPWHGEFTSPTGGAEEKGKWRRNGRSVCTGIVVPPGSESSLRSSNSSTWSNGESLAEHLERAGVTDVYVVGLAMDYCVLQTAVDAARFGFRAWIVKEGTRAVGGREGVVETMERCGEEGVGFVGIGGEECGWVTERGEKILEEKNQ